MIPRYMTRRANMDYALKQFLFFLTFAETKQQVYQEVRTGLSVFERLKLIQMERRRGEWFGISGPALQYLPQSKNNLNH